MKKYLQARDLLAEIEQVFPNRHSLEGYEIAKHPLETALVLLLHGRNFLGVELTLDFPGKGGIKFAAGSRAGAHAECAAPVRVASHSFGKLNAFRDKSLSGQDRVLLKEAGRRIALFLASGQGKHLIQHLREHAQAPVSVPRVAAAGDKIR